MDNDPLQVVANSFMLLGGDGSGLTINNNLLQIDPHAYNHLAASDVEVINYRYQISDGQGGLLSRDATLTVNGLNDVPHEMATLSDKTNEDVPRFARSLLDGVADVDGDPLNVVDNSFTIFSGDGTGLFVQGNFLGVDPNAYNGLAQGDLETV